MTQVLLSENSSCPWYFDFNRKIFETCWIDVFAGDLKDKLFHEPDTSDWIRISGSCVNLSQDLWRITACFQDMMTLS